MAKELNLPIKVRRDSFSFIGMSCGGRARGLQLVFFIFIFTNFELTALFFSSLDLFI